MEVVVGDFIHGSGAKEGDPRSSSARRRIAESGPFEVVHDHVGIADEEHVAREVVVGAGMIRGAERIPTVEDWPHPTCACEPRLIYADINTARFSDRTGRCIQIAIRHAAAPRPVPPRVSCSHRPRIATTEDERIPRNRRIGGASRRAPGHARSVCPRSCLALRLRRSVRV